MGSPHYAIHVIARKNDEAIQALGLSKFWIATVCRVADLVPLGGNRPMFAGGA